MGFHAISGLLSTHRSAVGKSAIAALAAAIALGTPERAVSQAEASEAAPRPNIVLIVADDLGWGQPGFNGGTQVSTPNIDRIADEGVKLTQFYVQPQCAPTRAALLTGRYDWKNGVLTIPHPEKTGGLRLDERTIAEALGDAGYATWIVGKWHLGHWLTEHLPLQRGFDHHYGMYTGQLRSFTHTRGAYGSLVLDWHRNGRPVVESGYSSFLLADEAAQLIGRHDGASPFFLYLPFNAVHTPHEAPQEYLDLYSGQTKYKQRAMLKAMDDAIGSVLAALEEKGVLDDTLVIFLSDNGDAPEARTTGQSPYRGQKATYFEGGIRVPAVARWPGEITAGTESDALLHAVDVFPTFAGLAGASTTDGLPLDGLDAWAAIADGAQSPRTEVVHSPFVLRQGDWKLIERIAHTSRWVSGELHLFNIAEDPYETTNLAESEPDRVDEMAARLDHLAQFSRANDGGVQITDSPVLVFGEEENDAFGTAVQAALTARGSGNTGPTAVRLEAVGDQVKLSFDEALDADAVPSASAFDVVMNPGYRTAAIEDVDIDGHAVLLTLAEAPAATDTVGLTYNVPDAGAVRDLDDLEAAGVTWVTGAVTSAFLSGDATLRALSLSGIDIGTFSSTVTAYNAEVENGISTTTVTATASHTGASVSIAPGAEVSLTEGENEIAVTVTAEDGLTTRTYTVAVTRAASSDDATLSALSLSGIDIGTFSSTVTAYTAEVGNGVVTTAVTATPNHSAASVSIAPGSEVSLAEGSNEITVTVTAEDGLTTQGYTVTVTRAVPPVISIEAVTSPVSEGERAQFRVTRVGSLTDALSVDIRAGRVDISMPFRPGRRSHVGSTLAGDDTIVEDDVAVTWTIQEDDAYTIAPDAGSATVVVEDDDVAEFTVAIDPAVIAEDESATVEVKVTNGVTFAADQTIEFDFAGSTATKDADYTVSPGTPSLAAGARRTTATVTAVVDSNTEADETVSLATKHNGNTIGTVSLTIKDAAAATPLTARFLGVPATHDGESAFEFELRFSEEFPLGYKRLRDDAFDVTGGTVRRAKRLVQGSNLRWTIRILPAGDGEVVVVLPATMDCAATGALCTASAKPLSNRLSATVNGPEPAETQLTLGLENGSPSGIWSDGGTAWVADVDDGMLYAYQLIDGTRLKERDIETEPGAMALWSDGDTLWAAGLEGTLRAHRLSDGRRLNMRDVALSANEEPVGLWSDGETMWVTDWLGGAAHAYRLTDGQHLPNRDIRLAGENLLPVGLWSDGETLWVADWAERIYAYRLSDGERQRGRDIVAAGWDTDPSGLWSDGETLLSTSWHSSVIRSYRLPEASVDEDRQGPFAGTLGLADPALRSAVAAALAKASREAQRVVNIAELQTLHAYNAGVMSLAGLEAAVALKDLDLRFNPLEDLGPLASLPALESLNLDGATFSLDQILPLVGLKRLSVRHSEIESLGPLAGLAALTELDVGRNHIDDLQPLTGLPELTVLRADGNRISDLWPLALLTRLEVLDLQENRVRDLLPLAGLAQLETLRLGGNGLTQLYPLAGLTGIKELGLVRNAVEDLRALSSLDSLQRLDLRGNTVGDLWPLRGMQSLVWVNVGGSRIENLDPLEGLPRLTLAGRNDRDPPTVADERTRLRRGSDGLRVPSR